MEDKITFEIKDKITLDQAWKYILTFLKISGYSIVPNDKFHFIVRTNDKDLNKQPYPLFVQTVPADFPNSDQTIRLIYYFSNIQAVLGNDKVNSLEGILASVLSKDADARIDANINGVIITDRARHIISLMEILTRFDTLNETELVEIIPLEYTAATTIATFFQKLLPGTNANTIDPSIPATSTSLYFSKSIHIIPEPRRNVLITMGKKSALARVHAFIKKHLDVPTDSGDSVLHLYYLQHLDAVTFQSTLQSIVQLQGPSQQSSGTAQASEGEQYFKDVVITADTKQSAGSGNASVASGNRLIIAARKNDWIRIKKLIEELDKPQMQIAIEVLIVDLNLQGTKKLGNQIRTKDGMVSNNNITAQTAHLSDDVLLKGGSGLVNYDADALLADLLQSGAQSGTIASNAAAGSLILAFNEKTRNGIWLVTQILNTYKDVKIISQPFIITLNNQKTTFYSEELRYLQGNISQQSGGVINTYKPVSARLSIEVTPMISNSKDVNLGLNIGINEWGDGYTQSNRTIHTNVNIRDGEVLVLGGLTKTNILTADTETPLLSKIPVLGWLFKSRSKTTIKENLLVFISPRIIQPASMRGKNQHYDAYTSRKIGGLSSSLSSGENFELLSDPISRWFFGSNENSYENKKINSLKNRSLINFNQDSDKFDIGRSGVQNSESDTSTEAAPSVTEVPMPTNTPEQPVTPAVQATPEFVIAPTAQSAGPAQQPQAIAEIPQTVAQPTTTPLATTSTITTTEPVGPQTTSQTPIAAQAAQVATPEIQKSIVPAKPLTEEEELKQLFAQLKMPI